MSMLKLTYCRSCNAKVYFVKDDDGTTQILDAVAPVFRVSSAGEIVCGRVTNYFVSHFSTCPDASSWSHGKRPKI